MEHLVLELAARYGYLIVLAGVGIESMGVPAPGETVLLAGAVLAARGHLSAPFVGLAGWGGAVLGDNLGYLIGRRWGRGLVRAPGFRRLYSPRRLEAADRFFTRHGWLAVFLGRFAALLRIFAGPLAGIHRMPWSRFVLANGAGALLWVGAVVTLGLVIGDNLDLATTILARSGYAGLVALLLIAALVLRHQLRSGGSRRRPPPPA